MSISPKVKSYTISKNSVEVSVAPGQSINLSVNTKTRINPPMDPQHDNTALLDIELHVNSQNDATFSVVIIGNVVFEFEENPESYTGEIEQICSNLGIKKISEVLDESLGIMNYPQLYLFEKLKEINSVQ